MFYSCVSNVEFFDIAEKWLNFHWVSWPISELFGIITRYLFIYLNLLPPGALLRKLLQAVVSIWLIYMTIDTKKFNHEFRKNPKNQKKSDFIWNKKKNSIMWFKLNLLIFNFKSIRCACSHLKKFNLRSDIDIKLIRHVVRLTFSYLIGHHKYI